MTWAGAAILAAALAWWCRFWLALGVGQVLRRLRPGSRLAARLLRYGGS